MTDQEKPLEMWELHFHRTMTIAHQELDVFTLKLRDPKAAFLTFTVPHSREGMDLVHQVCMRMNHDDRTVMLNSVELHEIEAAFHGPWYNSPNVGRYIMVTDAEVLKISRFIYRQSQIRVSVEGQFRCLLEDHQKLVKMAAAMEQELLRLHHLTSAEAQSETVADLLTPDTDEGQLEIPDMACKKPVLCRLDQPNNNRRMDVV